MQGAQRGCAPQIPHQDGTRRGACWSHQVWSSGPPAQDTVLRLSLPRLPSLLQFGLQGPSHPHCLPWAQGLWDVTVPLYPMKAPPQAPRSQPSLSVLQLGALPPACLVLLFLWESDLSSTEGAPSVCFSEHSHTMGHTLRRVLMPPNHPAGLPGSYPPHILNHLLPQHPRTSLAHILDQSGAQPGPPVRDCSKQEQHSDCHNNSPAHPAHAHCPSLSPRSRDSRLGVLTSHSGVPRRVLVAVTRSMATSPQRYPKCINV